MMDRTESRMAEAEIRAHFEKQVEACRLLGSPFTARVCALLGERLRPETKFGRRIFGWSGNPGLDALPLRATGGLNALARSGRLPALAAVYPPHEATDEALWAAIEAAMAEHDPFLAAYLDGPPQTNEVTRSSAILGGCLHIAAATGLPLDLYEIGASAGLNLRFDQYTYQLDESGWGDPAREVRIVSRWDGNSPPLDAPLAVRSRRGCDRNPLDARSEDHRARLLSYVWPDQTDRLQRLDAALREAARVGTAVEKADAADWIEANFGSAGSPGSVKVLFHTIVWQYLPPETKARIAAAVQASGAAATVDAPVAWLRVEADEVVGSAGIRLTLWPSGEERLLGRADFHGRQVMWM